MNVDGVEPMTSVTPMEMKKRADKVTDGGIADDIVKNAPATAGPFLPGAEGGGIRGRPPHMKRGPATLRSGFPDVPRL